jgi:hypothetical protein
MKIPEKFTEIYSLAKKIDSNLEKQALENNGGSPFIPRNVVARNIEWIILREKEINDLKEEIHSKQNDIDTAKQRLKEYGIEIPDATI